MTEVVFNIDPNEDTICEASLVFAVGEFRASWTLKVTVGNNRQFWLDFVLDEIHQELPGTPNDDNLAMLTLTRHDGKRLIVCEEHAGQGREFLQEMLIVAMITPVEASL